jgi:cytidylate kinase
MTTAGAVQELARRFRTGEVAFGPVDGSSPCGIRILGKGRDFTEALWASELDPILKELSKSPEAIDRIRMVVGSMDLSRPLVVVGREAGTEFFPNAGLKLILTSHDRVRKARKRKQLSRFNGTSKHVRVDSSEPGIAILGDGEAIAIDTTDLSPAEVFEVAESIVKTRLGWRRIADFQIL